MGCKQEIKTPMIVGPGLAMLVKCLLFQGSDKFHYWGQGPKFRTIQLSKAWYTQNRTWRLWRRGVVCMVIFFILGYMVEVWFWKVSTEASHGYGKKTKFIPSKQKTQKKYRDIHQLKLACCIVLDRVGNYTNGKVRLKNVTLILPPLGEIGSLIT